MRRWGGRHSHLRHGEMAGSAPGDQRHRGTCIGEATGAHLADGRVSVQGRDISGKALRLLIR
jgi:hypothetical protein